MRTHLIGIMAGAAAIAAAASPASAVVIDFARSTLGGATVTDFSTAGELSFTAALRPGDLLNLRLVLGAGDLGAPLAFNASLTNADFLRNLGTLTLSLEGAAFASFGDVAPFLSTVQTSAFLPGSIDLTFSAPGEPAGVDLGSLPPFGGRDFTIGTAGRAAGDTFTVRIQVPEPASITLMLGGLLGLAGLRRKRG